MCGYSPVCFLSGNFVVNMIIPRGARLGCICTCRRAAEAHVFWWRSTAVAAATFLHLCQMKMRRNYSKKHTCACKTSSVIFTFFHSPHLLLSLFPYHTCLIFPPNVFWVTLQTRDSLEAKPCISFPFTFRNILIHLLLTAFVCMYPSRINSFLLCVSRQE